MSTPAATPPKNWARQAAFLVVATLALLMLAARLQPFTALRMAITNGGRSYTLLKPKTIPGTARTSEPLKDDLASRALPGPGVKRIVVLGTSQLANLGNTVDGENPPGQQEGMVGLLASELSRRMPGKYWVYNASMQAMTLQEALWQLVYWYRVDPIPPAVLVLSMDMGEFRGSTVRGEMSSALDNDRVAAAIDQMIRENGAYSSAFHAAKENYAQQKKEAAFSATSAGAKTAMNDVSVQNRVEGFLRDQLERFPPYARRVDARVDLLTSLYLLRVRLLGMGPNSRRHIGGRTYDLNLATLGTIVRLARGAGSKVLVFNAPRNPLAKNQYYTEEYSKYQADLAELVKREGLAYVDLENAAEGSDYGFWINAPDAMHMTAPGHKKVAARLYEALAPVLDAP